MPPCSGSETGPEAGEGFGFGDCAIGALGEAAGGEAAAITLFSLPEPPFAVGDDAADAADGSR